MHNVDEDDNITNVSVRVNYVSDVTCQRFQVTLIITGQWTSVRLTWS